MRGNELRVSQLIRGVSLSLENSASFRAKFKEIWCRFSPWKDRQELHLISTATGPVTPFRIALLLRGVNLLFSYRSNWKWCSTEFQATSLESNASIRGMYCMYSTYIYCQISGIHPAFDRKLSPSALHTTIFLLGRFQSSVFLSSQYGRKTTMLWSGEVTPTYRFGRQLSGTSLKGGALGLRRCLGSKWFLGWLSSNLRAWNQSIN